MCYVCDESVTLHSFSSLICRLVINITKQNRARGGSEFTEKRRSGTSEVEK
ncbi:hypothetical protein HanIR_Chr08g0359511 [Helianthus annuus]|nr:hypothetical protein HanIR_Chr08g0359511 [Helianthus annuus]